MPPIITAARKVNMDCRIAIITTGYVYPIMNSLDLIGAAYRRIKKAVDRSFDTCKQVNNITKVKPNTAMPGARF
jgi:hypothetical protein